MLETCAVFVGSHSTVVGYASNHENIVGVVGKFTAKV